MFYLIDEFGYVYNWLKFDTILSAYDYIDRKKLVGVRPVHIMENKYVDVKPEDFKTYRKGYSWISNYWKEVKTHIKQWPKRCLKGAKS